MWKKAEPLKLTSEQRKTLRALAGKRSTPSYSLLRVQIVLGAAEGFSNNALAKKLGTSRQTVIYWRKAFSQMGTESLKKPRYPGRPTFYQNSLIQAVLARIEQKISQGKPWSVRLMSEAFGLCPSTIHRIWKKYGAKRDLVTGTRGI